MEFWTAFDAGFSRICLAMASQQFQLESLPLTLAKL